MVGFRPRDLEQEVTSSFRIDGEDKGNVRSQWYCLLFPLPLIDNFARISRDRPRIHQLELVNAHPADLLNRLLQCLA